MRVSTLLWTAAAPAVATAVTPVQRVIKLLNDMKSQLDDERKADEKLYKDLQCWCKTNKDAKEKSIAEGKNKAKNLEADIKKYAGSSGEYKANMELAEKNVAKAEEKAQKEEESHETLIKGLRGDETDLVATVNALDSAITMLSKHNSMVQKKSSLLQAIGSVAHFASQKSKIMHGKIPTMKNSFLQAAKGPDALVGHALADDYTPLLNFEQSRNLLRQFLQTTHKQVPSHLGPYESQSGGVFGVLTQMKENFAADLEETRTQIKQQTEGYKKMKASIQAELKTQRKAFNDTKANYGKAQFMSTEGNDELNKVRDAVAADTDVMSAVKLKCQSLDTDWALRSKARQDEIEAVDKAVEIMTSDENRESLGFAFIQTSKTESKRDQKIRSDVSSLLKNAASNISWSAFTAADVPTLNRQQLLKQKQALMQAAQSVKLDAFTKVKELIDKMVTNIKQQMVDDVKIRDQCGLDIKDNEQANRDAKRLFDVTGSNIEGLEAEIEGLKEGIKGAIAEVAETETGIKRASEEREEENKNFQTTVQEQRDMHVVLLKAFTVLKDHYKKNESLVQIQKVGGQKENLIQQTPLPGEFTPYKQNAGSNSVLVMFEKIMVDCVKTEQEAQKTEADSQATYETFVADSNKAIDSLNDEISTMRSNRADKGKNLSDEKTTLKDTEGEIKALTATNGALHGECDFLIKYFSVRQEAMSNEIAACQKAKAILSGAK